MAAKLNNLLRLGMCKMSNRKKGVKTNFSQRHNDHGLSWESNAIQESILPNYVFLRFLMLAVKLECL